MRVNEDTALVGKLVVLVPYRKEHVETYHEWMKDPELLDLTASMSLTLEEEYEMQRSWHLDEDKLTFIILARSSFQKGLDILPTADDVARMKMIGDVNMFFKDEGEVECEVMIAERDYHRKGYGLEALRLLFRYATDQTSFSSSTSFPASTTPLSQHLPVNPTSLIVRVGALNTPSIALFQKLGFGVSKHVEVFNEVEMKFAWDSNMSQHKDVDKWVSSWTQGDEEAIGLQKLSI